MAMAKKAMINSDKSGRISVSEIKGAATSKREIVPIRRVAALYPLEPTTIEEAVLDKAITKAVDKRLRQKT